MTSISSYGLITEQKKGAYKYFVDLDGSMQPVASKTAYIDEVSSVSNYAGFV
jgi:ATP-dependent DNA helicase 2 subunit 1